MTEEEKLSIQLGQAIVELHRLDSVLTVLYTEITQSKSDINKIIERIENAGMERPNRRSKTRSRNTKKI